ncbi:hypothetical protein MMC07_009068, partial [Pseudocyphellaria aurata]|nr:hypothetical protein [Pseudocyphellaria aurata]
MAYHPKINNGAATGDNSTEYPLGLYETHEHSSPGLAIRRTQYLASEVAKTPQSSRQIREAAQIL